MKIKLYWDACVWIALLNEEADRIKEIRSIYKAAQQGKFEIWTSTVSMVEVFHLGIEKPPYEDAKHLTSIKELFEQQFIKRIPLDVEVAGKARGVRRNNPSIKVGDSIHLASALVKAISPLHTWDHDDLVSLSGKFSMKQQSGKLIIETPQLYVDDDNEEEPPNLFDQN
jgi:predicted nucleic acid-binding protein